MPEKNPPSSEKEQKTGDETKDPPTPETVQELHAQAAEDDKCPVAAVGASAGGLEALSELLEHLPPNPGGALVLIQHLDPKHSSMLRELLARTTPLPVIEAENRMPLKRNHVYVIPPNSSMTLAGGSLQVEPRHDGAGSMPIDTFFRSLAQERGSLAIGAVLSGTASDGTLGLRAIKGEGGLTFAQDPEEARYDGMPRNAIASGAVDSVMRVEAIARELGRLFQHPYLEGPKAEETPTGDRSFDGIFSLLRLSTGVDFRHYKQGTIRRRTERRMALLKIGSPKEYLRHLKEDPAELDRLFQDILINVTAFFRENTTFEALTSHFFAPIFQGRSPDDPVRVWVPGCATGEECYSIAICLLEYMREHRVEALLQIFGTDLSESALARARLGQYPETISANVSTDRLRRFFVRSNGGYQIARVVRDMCIFARQNVTKDPPFSRLDMVLCRNLLIYLGPVLQASTMRLFHYALNPNGILALGLSESIGLATDLFSLADKHHRIYRRKSASMSISGDVGVYEERDVRTPAERRHGDSLNTDQQRRLDQLLLSRYSAPAVLVDRELRISQFRGETSRYLGHAAGDANLSLLKMGRGGMGIEIRKLVREAEQTQVPATNEFPVPLTGGLHRIRVTVHPMGAKDQPDLQFLVVFDERSPTPAPSEKHSGKAKVSATEKKNVDLENELGETKHYLQSLVHEHEAANEELKTAHEEVQSSNEELQSTNEELLTAKEELQSTNEELTTLNEEMQSRNSELQRLNNDLINLLSSVNIPIVMLGGDLKIRRFTPQAEKILNLLPADIGRPISDFRIKVNVPSLQEQCQEVVETLAAREREVQDDEGRTYSMWIRPYRTVDNRIDGVVLSLFDITERKQATEARYRRLFESANDGIIVAAADTGEVLDINFAITRRFGFTRSSMLGARFWQMPLFRNSGLEQGILSELTGSEAIQRTLTLSSSAAEPMETDLVIGLYSEGERKVVQFNLRDQSARKRVEEKQRRGDDELRQSQKMEAVGRLAGGVAHDFNNLLTAVLGYSEMLSQTLEEDHPGQRLTAQIVKAGERAVLLTRQLLAFGRKQVQQRVRLKVEVVFNEMRQLLGVMLRDNVELAFEVHGEPAPVVADRGQIEQVILNLVLNARDAMPKGGRIAVDLADVTVDEQNAAEHPMIPSGHYVTLTIKDTGTGISPETQAHLYEPFFTTKPPGSGVGLGLSTVYGIVSQSGGYIRLLSEMGIGSSFIVYLPAAPEGGGEVEAPQTREELPRGHGENILLVDDEAALLQLGRTFLEALNYRVLSAPSGPEALRISREHNGRIDLLVTDVVMPRMSGREVAFQLEPQRPEMRMLYTSGHTESVVSHHGVLTDGVAFLQKPYTQHSLAVKVRDILDGAK